jgi:hypothetical protein
VLNIHFPTKSQGSGLEVLKMKVQQSEQEQRKGAFETLE